LCRWLKVCVEVSWRTLCVASVAVLLTACGTQPIASATYTVKSGDTLYSIGQRTGTDLRELARLNRIDSSYRIYPGQVLRLSRSVAMPRTTATPSVTIDNRTPAIAPPSTIKWNWPTHSSNDGSSYKPTTRPNGGIGLLFNGQAGQAINATAAGRVVYTGSGLLGYGQLIIIKHDEIFLSAYGHVESVLVHEGEQVIAGQKLASMGNNSTGTPLLYFEIRVNGQPTDPLPLLQGQ
jgi:lipoprotein NlpD